MEKNIAILTKSSKNKRYCVAGIDMNNGMWVRLVSADEISHGALSNDDMRYDDGSPCNILDVAKIQIVCPAPNDFQPENVLIDAKKPWKRLGHLSIKDVLSIHPAERHSVILGNKYAYLTDAKIGTVGHSLVLIQVRDLMLSRSENLKTKAQFYYGAYKYEKMSVTDPQYYSVVDPMNIGNAVLVVSLPDAPHNEKYYYKFIAKIFPL